MWRALGLAMLLCAPGAARAHPHVFIDGGVEFVFDAEGLLTDLKVTWIYDPLTSLFMFEDLGIDPAATPLGADDRARLAAYQTEWDASFDGDSYLWDGERPIGLSGPQAPDAALIDGRVAIRFTRKLDTPFRPGPETVVKVYDPTYYTAYMVTETPRLEGAAAGCRAAVERYEPSGPLQALQETLSTLPADASPEDEDVGALFADQVFVTCD